MKSPSVSMLLGVSVLLLSGLTVSAVSVNVSPNLQQFFEGNPVSLSCVEDGQTVKRTVNRTRGENTEECGTSGSSFGNFSGSSCTIANVSRSDSAFYWCDSSGQRRDQVNITVTTAKDLILEIPALPVRGSAVTLHCRNKDGPITAYFFRNGTSVTDSKLEPEFNISNIQQSNEGFYHCANDEKESAQSWLRVTDPPPTTTPHPPTKPFTVKSPFTSFTPSSPRPPASTTPSPSFPIIPVTAVLGALVLLVLVLVGVLLLRNKQTGKKDSSVDVTYADIKIRQQANRNDKPSTDPDTVYSTVRTHKAEPAEVTYGEVVIKHKKKADRRTEQPSDPDVVYSSVRRGV
ncbi:uncharacterized protein [Channa argus]|uniref:uncharacterized protein n=1 Tax=Channa argus TaxID=215402 RepID=UPI003522B545